MTSAHVEKETLCIDIDVPEHADRVTTPLFDHTRKQLIARDKVCWICGCATPPLEAHHFPIERSMAEMIDWSEGSQIRRDYPNFDWDNFTSPYDFVDNMMFNGLLLCKVHHIGKDEGIHYLPHPLWIAQKYGKDGYQFSDVEIIHHEQE